MFCPNCGKEVAPTADFCPYCGTKLDHPTGPKPHQPAAQSTEHLSAGAPAGNHEKNSKKAPIIITIVIIALLAVIAFMLGMQNSGSNSSSPAASKTASTASKSNAATSSSARPNFNQQQTAAAILYYAQENEANRMWSDLYHGALTKLTNVTSSSLPDEATARGDGTMHAYYPTGAAFGGETGYVMDNDGQTVYLYRVGPGEDKIDPDDTVTLKEIEQYVIDHHAMEQVNQVAGNIKFD